MTQSLWTALAAFGDVDVAGDWPLPTERRPVHVRMPFECREPGSHRLKYNASIVPYCRGCQALRRFDKCLRADPDEIRRLLKREPKAAKTCKRCGQEFETPGRYCDRCADLAPAEAARARRERDKHPCAFPGCRLLAPAGSTFCGRHTRAGHDPDAPNASTTADTGGQDTDPAD